MLKLFRPFGKLHFLTKGCNFPFAMVFPCFSRSPGPSKGCYMFKWTAEDRQKIGRRCWWIFHGSSGRWYSQKNWRQKWGTHSYRSLSLKMLGAKSLAEGFLYWNICWNHAARSTTVHYFMLPFKRRGRPSTLPTLPIEPIFRYLNPNVCR